MSWLSICPNCNAIIFSLSRARALKRIQWWVCQISLHSAHPKERTWAKRHHALHRCWSVEEHSPMLWPEKLQSTLRSIHRANKAYRSQTKMYIWQTKYQINYYFLGHQKRMPKPSICWLLLHNCFYFGFCCSLLLRTWISWSVTGTNPLGAAAELWFLTQN